MRNLGLLACALLSAGLSAQSPLNTGLLPNNQGNNGGGLYFDLQVNTIVSITSIDSWVGTNGLNPGDLALEMYLGPSTYAGNVTNAALWAPVSTAIATGYVPNSAAYQLYTFNFQTPVTLGPGNYGVALRSQGAPPVGTVAWNHGYTNGLACTSTTVPGACSNTIFSNAEMTVRGGAAQNAFLSGGIFTPRMWAGSISYTLGGQPVAVAAWENYGSGCNRDRTSFYQFYPNPGSINVGTPNATESILMSLGNNANYVVSTGTNAYVAPSPTAGIASFPTGNDFVLASAVLGGPLPVPILYPSGGTLTFAADLEINADGFILPVPASNAWQTPLPANFNGGAARWAPHWKNMDVVTGGTITVEIESTTGAVVVSWNAVVDAGFTTSSSFQVAFYPNADVEYRYGAMSVNGGGNLPVLIGWTPGLSLDNEVDVSVVSLTTSPIDNQEMSQIMSARPRLGTTPTFVASDIANASFGASLLAFAQINPGFDLAGFGMPGCRQYTGIAGLDVGVAQIVFPVGGTLTQAFPIPANVALNGLQVFAQMAAFAAGQNPTGLIWSNGTRMFVGSL